MNECKHCGHQNENFFKFCLACGADLTIGAETKNESPAAIEVPHTAPVTRRAALAADTVQMPVLDEAALAAAPESEVAPLPLAKEVPDFSSPLKPDTEVAAAPSEKQAMPVPELSWARVPEATPAPFEALRPEERAAAGRPGAHAVTLDGLPPQPDSDHKPPTTPLADPDLESLPMPSRRCPGCGALSPLAHAFCGQCGYRFEDRSTATRTDSKPAADRRHTSVQVVVINEDGSDGGKYPLFEGVNTIGRSGTDVEFGEDIYLDPHHADVLVDGDLVTITDRESLNGTFIRITEPALIEHGDTFRVGQELMRYEEVEQFASIIDPPPDDTELLGAPAPDGTWGRLVQVINPDLTGNAFLLTGRFVTIGRERGDITFPGDGYVSGRHATLTRRAGSLYLEDLDSSNGTYVRVKGSAAVFDGDLLLLGQQLFRVAA